VIIVGNFNHFPSFLMTFAMGIIGRSKVLSRKEKLDANILRNMRLKNE